MKRTCMGLTTMLAFAVFGTATALAQPAKPDVNIGDKTNTKYFISAIVNLQEGDVQEEVEILRRLLEKSFEAVYGHRSESTWIDLGSGMGSRMGLAMPGISYSMLRQGERFPGNLQGVYLKDYGVVYTVTLPPPPNGMLPGPAVGAVTRTPLSPWERTRKELRGEKIAEGKPVGGSPSLSELILKVLADNGKHFNRLAAGGTGPRSGPPSERITVVVTFRNDGVYQPQQGSVPGMPSFGGSSGSQRMPFPGGSSSMPHPGGSGAPQRMPFPGGSSMPYPGGSSMPPGSGPLGASEDVPAWAIDVRNNLTLGDLHVKQQNIAAAIAAYNKAQEQLEKGLDAEKDAGRILTAAHLFLHLSTGYDSAGDKVSARKAIERVESLAKKAATLTGEASAAKAPSAAPPALPSKLIVTASKKLMDEVGSGKMTFEAFSKAATVEYIKPSADKK